MQMKAFVRRFPTNPPRRHRHIKVAFVDKKEKLTASQKTGLISLCVQTRLYSP